MNQPINLKTAILGIRNSIRPVTAGCCFLLVSLACFALLPTAQAQLPSPTPDGGYPNSNTAEGTNALKSLTTGTDNTAMGESALQSNTGGSFNTATGFDALVSNTTGGANTATGMNALFSNTTGGDNTANGMNALGLNTTGSANTANGASALASNTTGNFNAATGLNALFSNTTGSDNTATGVSALASNTTGGFNTATGEVALQSNTTGGGNTASGGGALQSNTSGINNTATGASALASNTTGSNNIALGFNAGVNLTRGSNNIDIGAAGMASESNTIRIGTVGVHKNAYIKGISGTTVASGVTVIVDTKGHLGTIVSSERFKEAIKPMDKASEAILALKPVTFHYKHELDPDGIPQFGLIAEQVEKVNPDLVARDADGKINTVRYEAVNAMLLNEFLKEHKKVEEQAATIRQLSSIVAEQQKVFTARLKEQDSKIQAVNERLEVSKPAPQLVADNQ